MFSSASFAKEISLTFDDAPGEVTAHFTPAERTDLLIKKLTELNVPPVIIFANPCNGLGPRANLKLLKKFKDAGHVIGNHTCTHARLDEVGYEKFIGDIKKADSLLSNLSLDGRYFRFPFFNEGTDVVLRNKVRTWLIQNNYRSISSTLENEDPIFSAKINEAKGRGNKIDYSQLKKIFLKHVLDGVDFYDALSLKMLNRPVKHNILLHDKDATVLFIDDLVKELRLRGWTIISAQEMVDDPIFTTAPINTLSSYGILGQIFEEKHGGFTPYYDFKALKSEIDRAITEK